jgi:hypothetical protein
MCISFYELLFCANPKLQMKKPSLRIRHVGVAQEGNQKDV